MDLTGILEDKRVTDLGGFNVLVNGRDAIYVTNKNDVFVGRSLCLYGEYCEQEFDLLRAMAKPGMCIVDVGANCGSHAVRLAKIVGANGRVVAIEPQPPVFQELAATMALNSLTNVDCYPYILTDKNGFATIPAMNYNLENNFGGMAMNESAHAGAVVPSRRFDDIYALPRLDIMKIDVEGMELDVLKGAAESVRRFKPMIYLENDRKDRSQPLLEWLFAEDYRLWWHFPALFNPNNFFANPTNVFGGVASVNVLAVPKHIEPSIGLPEIKDATEFPQTTVMPRD